MLPNEAAAYIRQRQLSYGHLRLGRSQMRLHIIGWRVHEIYVISYTLSQRLYLIANSVFTLKHNRKCQ